MINVSHVSDANKKPIDIMKLLESFIIQEVQTLQKVVTIRLQALVELAKTGKKNIKAQMKETKGDLNFPVHYSQR